MEQLLKLNKQRPKRHLSSFRMIILSFAGAIMLGTLLLMLPISSRSGVITPFADALFTATSATCVTGLVVRDTASYWSPFGQVIILIMIQVGGMGVLTMAVLLTLLSGRKVSLMQRSIMQESYASSQVGGLVKLTLFIIKITLIVELTGAVLMAPVFCRQYGVRGLFLALFHSISAFCNAGFDLMGTQEAQFVSLTGFAANPWICFVIMMLIIIGGIGFLTWDNIRLYKWHFKKYRLQSKIILTTSAVLILLPFLFYFVNDYADLSFGRRLLAALFQAVTPRTAGFNTMDLNLLSGGGKVIMIILMLIGGSPGSTAGGMKTTTAAVLFTNMIAVFGKNGNTNLFGRKIDPQVIRNASTILMLYLTICLGGGIMISTIENLPVGTCLFETASAIGTVGLTLGITPGLGQVSRLLLIFMMFTGRVGGLTLIFATTSKKTTVCSNLPTENVTVG